MSKVAYFAIDKSIIKEGESYEFSLFIPSNVEKKMECLLSSNRPVTRAEIEKLKSIEKVYINEKKRAYYLNYYSHIINHEQSKHISFEDKASQAYKKACEILSTLFTNPEDVKAYEMSKEVVNEMVETVTDNDFNIESIVKIAEHSYSSVTHSINVAIYALNFGKNLKMDAESLKNLGEAALLHDIGKSKISSTILDKNDKLTDKEYAEVKKHPMLGYTIALKLGIKNKDVLAGIKLHQERMDGSGYPLKFKGESIPLIARILAVCDVFDAMTSKKNYRESIGAFEALLYMKTKMSKQLDVNLVNKMIETFR